jgi:predicted AlkP superfamily phosphohydrolase/phosphomutase/tetratricopeptide (TPR) repeat protein
MSRLLLVGWDAADWKVIRPLLAAGEMPNLAGLIARGVHGNLSTIHPPLSPMVWTSIATGKRPPAHGIHGFTEPSPDGLSVRPITNRARRTKAFWNVAHQNGLRSIVAGWWPSHPAEPIRGAMVSDQFPLKGEDPVGRPMRPDAVSPASWAARLAELRVHPSEIDGDILNLFVPGWDAIDQSKDKSLHDLATIIAETMSIHAAATDLLEHEPWDLAAVYYCGVDHFSHRFMRYHAGKRFPADKDGTDPALFREVVRNAYRYHDVMLGRLMSLADPDTSVMVLSDHGFHSDRLLPDHIPAEAAGPAVEHRNFGIFCLAAPGVRAGQELFGASVLDIAPTVLHLLGLPAGNDMDGKVLVNAFENPGQPVTIESWDAVEGDAGLHNEAERYDPTDAAESLKQLVALGYVAPPKADARDTVADCLREQRYNLARAQIDASRPDLAAVLLHDLIADDAEQSRFYMMLAGCYLQMRDFAGYRRLLAQFDKAAAEFAPRAVEELKRRRAEEPDREIAEAKRQHKDEAAARRELFERRQLAEKTTGFVTERLFLRCRLLLARGRSQQEKGAARTLLDQLAKVRNAPVSLRLFLAEGFAALKDCPRALKLLDQVRRMDPENAEASALAARIHFAERRWHKTVDSAVESLSLVYGQPWLHHLLGAALAKLNEPAKAEAALRASLALFPENPDAMAALGRLINRDRARIGEGSLLIAHSRELRKALKERRAAIQEAPAADATPPAQGLPVMEASHAAPPPDRSRVVTIVAGLPRSGTSMMMQVLSAAGIQPFTDQKRLPDSDNPRGYFEHEKATALHRDTTWIPEARGKVVKVVAHLLRFLPHGEQYRVVFMHRDLEEVITSQKVMLARLKRKGGGLTDDRLRAAYTGQLVQVQTFLRNRPDIAVLPVDYAAALADPSSTAARLQAFLGGPFDTVAAAIAIEPKLRRQKLELVN